MVLYPSVPHCRFCGTPSQTERCPTVQCCMGPALCLSTQALPRHTHRSDYKGLVSQLENSAARPSRGQGPGLSPCLVNPALVYINLTASSEISSPYIVAVELNSPRIEKFSVHHPSATNASCGLIAPRHQKQSGHLPSDTRIVSRASEIIVQGVRRQCSRCYRNIEVRENI